MTSVTNLFTAILKAVGAVANNGGLFARLKKGPFNPQITLGIRMN